MNEVKEYYYTSGSMLIINNHLTDEKTNKAGNKTKCRAIESFKGLRPVSVSLAGQLNWTASLYFNKAMMLHKGVIAFCL